jgi:catechol 2,3-dioxygenase-like lactoylglutathione lyase family enzyme
MAAYGIDHLHLRSTDPEGAAGYFARLFGAEETGRSHPGGRLRIMLRLAGLSLYVEEVPEGTAGPPRWPHRGVEHLGLSVDDLDAALAEVRAKGAELLSGPESPRPGVRIAFLAAPDGTRVELVERRAAG